MIARPNFYPFCLARGDDTGTLAVSLIANRFLLWRGEHAHQGAISTLAWSPDGQFLASGGKDGVVHIWLATSGELLYSFQHGQAVRRLRWSQDGQRIAAISRERVDLWPFLLALADAA